MPQNLPRWDGRSLSGMNVRVQNRQSLCHLHSRRLREVLRFFVDLASRRSDIAGLAQVTLLVTGDAFVEDLNRRLLGRSGATDVLCLLYAAIPGESGGGSADLIVNVERAVAVVNGTYGGRPPGWNASRELALYVAHGCDHLMGHDDATTSERARMRRRELRWLRLAHRSGLTDELVEF